uniref:2-dehydropantoate 2-reductase n=1 Tax=Mycena chlorophos TaxID=658473 RepID=A0ABQ0M6S0_MYCCL|nr:predicted protein [Mycena chlorophos]
MRLHLAGTGALGSIVAHHLRRATSSAHSVVFLHADESDAYNAPNGLVVRTPGGSTTASTGLDNDCYEPSSSSPTPIESLILTTRAHNALPVIQRLLPRLSPDSTIVLVQNTPAVYDRLIQHIFVDPKTRPHMVLASTSHVGFFEGERRYGLLRQTHVGKFSLGIVTDPHGRDFEASLYNTASLAHERVLRLSDIGEPQVDPQYRRYRSLRNTMAAFLLTETLNPSWRPLGDVHVAQRQSLVIHSIIHPLTALMGCSTYEVFQQPSAVNIARRVCGEATLLFQEQAKEEARTWAPAEEMGSETMGIARIPPVLGQDRLLDECLRVAQSPETSSIDSSMLRAVRHNRPTEINFLNGYLLHLGKSFRVPMPTTAALYDMVKMRAAIPLDRIM